MKRCECYLRPTRPKQASLHFHENGYEPKVGHLRARNLTELMTVPAVYITSRHAASTSVEDCLKSKWYSARDPRKSSGHVFVSICRDEAKTIQFSVNRSQTLVEQQRGHVW